jgi:CDP-4-dehydro-6-deoxyglucose reductase, E3
MRIEAFVGQEVHTIDGQSGESLYSALQRAGLPLLSVCGGRASCGACRIQVLPEWWARLPAALETERRLLSVLPGRAAGDRLSCQIRLDEQLDGLAVRIKQKAFNTFSSKGASA